jgi:linoleate 10R-lipoxygenase
VLKGKIKGEKIKDDKTMIMEYLIQLVAKLPHNSLLRENLTNNLIKELWDSLDHPPLIHIGDKHRYREADGSNNVSKV